MLLEEPSDDGTADNAAAWAQLVLTIHDQGRRTATHKLAVLLALVDCGALSTGADGRAPTRIPVRDLVGRARGVRTPGTARLSTPGVVQTASPAGYERTVEFGMLSRVVPLSRFPDTYNFGPLGYLSLAAQKRRCSLYLMGVYADVERELSFRERWTAGGRKLDMGKACLRFRTGRGPGPRPGRSGRGVDRVDDYVELYSKARA